MGLLRFSLIARDIKRIGALDSHFLPSSLGVYSSNSLSVVEVAARYRYHYEGCRLYAGQGASMTGSAPECLAL